MKNPAKQPGFFSSVRLGRCCCYNTQAVKGFPSGHDMSMISTGSLSHFHNS